MVTIARYLKYTLFLIFVNCSLEGKLYRFLLKIVDKLLFHRQYHGDVFDLVAFVIQPVGDNCFFAGINHVTKFIDNYGCFFCDEAYCFHGVILFIRRLYFLSLSSSFASRSLIRFRHLRQIGLCNNTHRPHPSRHCVRFPCRFMASPFGCSWRGDKYPRGLICLDCVILSTRPKQVLLRPQEHPNY